APPMTGDAAEAAAPCDPPSYVTQNFFCRYFTHVSCGVPSNIAVGIYGDLSDCTSFCPDPPALKCYLYDGGNARIDPLPDGAFNEGGATSMGPPVPPGGTSVECETCLGGGRRPAGLRRQARRQRNAGRAASAGRYFAAMARLEAA